MRNIICLVYTKTLNSGIQRGHQSFPSCFIAASSYRNFYFLYSGKVDKTEQDGFSGNSFLCWFWASCWFLQVWKQANPCFNPYCVRKTWSLTLFCYLFYRFLIFSNMGQSLQSVMEEEKMLLSETTVLQLACRIVGVSLCCQTSAKKL